MSVSVLTWQEGVIIGLMALALLWVQYRTRGEPFEGGET